jgi:hypothetical protein
MFTERDYASYYLRGRMNETGRCLRFLDDTQRRFGIIDGIYRGCLQVRKGDM